SGIFQSNNGKLYIYTHKHQLKKLPSKVANAITLDSFQIRQSAQLEDVEPIDVSHLGYFLFTTKLLKPIELYQVGKQKFYTQFESVDDYVLVHDAKQTKFGLMRASTETVILEPIFDHIKFLNRGQQYVVLASKDSLTYVYYNDVMVSKTAYESI